MNHFWKPHASRCDMARARLQLYGRAVIQAIWERMVRSERAAELDAYDSRQVSLQPRKKLSGTLDRYGRRVFEKSKHPRAPSGRPDGGQFIDAHGGTSSTDKAKKPANTAHNVGRRQSGRGIARLSQSPKRNNTTSKHVYVQRSGTTYINNGVWDTLLGDRFDDEISRPVDGSKYRVPLDTINSYVDDYWDFVKDWGAPEWDQFFRVFGTPLPKAFEQISQGAAKRLELGDVARLGLRPEDVRFFKGMTVFAGSTKFVEVAYPIVMTEILSAIFIEPMVGAVVSVEAGTLVITHGKRVIKVAGTKLDELIEFFTRTGKLKKGAKLEEVGGALQKVLDQTADKLVPVKIPKVGSSHPSLPVRKNSKDPTHGIFNDRKPLVSGSHGGDALEVFGERIPRLSDDARIALEHVEGHAAAEMVKSGLTEAVIHINYQTGPCQYCIRGVQELLAEGQKLWVVFPDGVGYFTNKGWTPK